MFEMGDEEQWTCQYKDGGRRCLGGAHVFYKVDDGREDVTRQTVWGGGAGRGGVSALMDSRNSIHLYMAIEHLTGKACDRRWG